jgi:2-amino-4-hydroxy-6-hydroxymethyldihydropteridine diphosphokinase
MESGQQINEAVYIGLGSNIEDRERHLKDAIHLLQLHPDINICRCSSIYETDPVGFTEQAAFLNMVIQVETKLTPTELFHHMLEVESKLGRVRDIRWGPRTIDLDMLLFGQQLLDTPELLVPHPRMKERAFVLIPLLEIMDKQSIQAGASFQQDLKLLTGKEGVTKWGINNSLHEG